MAEQARAGRPPRHTIEPAPMPASSRGTWKSVFADVGRLNGSDQVVVVEPAPDEDLQRLIRRIHSAVHYYKLPFRIRTYRTDDGRVAIQRRVD